MQVDDDDDAQQVFSTTTLELPQHQSEEETETIPHYHQLGEWYY